MLLGIVTVFASDPDAGAVLPFEDDDFAAQGRFPYAVLGAALHPDGDLRHGEEMAQASRSAGIRPEGSGTTWFIVAPEGDLLRPVHYFRPTT